MPTDLKPLTEEEKPLSPDHMRDLRKWCEDTPSNRVLVYKSEALRLLAEVAAHRAAWEAFGEWFGGRMDTLTDEQRTGVALAHAKLSSLRAEAGLEGSE